MGEVYRARDTKLGREVALKVLPSEMASDPTRLSRFSSEAKTVAGLNHPNIVTLYSVDEAEGIHFLTMELVEGQPLDAALSIPSILSAAWLENDPFWDDLRDNAGFLELMRRHQAGT